jgi:hypothetical protein
MGLIGPYTLIRAISVFHITVAWFFLTAPLKAVDNNVVRERRLQPILMYGTLY